MKENKGKGVASGTEGEEDVQVLDDVTPLDVQKPGVQAGKRKDSALWTLVTFLLVEVPRNKSLVRLLLLRFQSSFLRRDRKSVV